MHPRRLSETRRSWHGVAEQLLAGPQYRRTGTIRLRVTPGGFATTKDPEVRVEGDHLVAAQQRLPLPGATMAGLAAVLGVDAGEPQDLYHDHSGVREDEALVVDATAAAHLASCYALADEALRHFQPDRVPVLWPEHFDVSVTVDDATYGAGLGDSYMDEPYAYVSPGRTVEGAFWNAPFGAARAMRDMTDVATLAEFYAEARRQIPA